MMKDYVGVECLCSLCGAVNDVYVKYEDYKAWRYRGALAQEAFPYLSPNKREMLISGTCPTCYDMMMGIFKDEDE